MIKRLTNITSILIMDFSVTLEKIQNDKNGNGRYRSIITHLKTLKKRKEAQSAVFTFTQHYCGDFLEACYILRWYISGWNEDLQEKQTYLKRLQKIEASEDWLQKIETKEDV